MQKKKNDMFGVHRGVLLLLLLSGFLFVFGCDRQPQAARQQAMPQVSFVTVKPETIELSTELPGRTSARRIAEIRPQVNGLVLQRLFEEGSKVSAGQILYRIDPAPFQAAVDNAGAALSAARKNKEQAQAALDAGRADVRQRNAALELAVLNRERFEEAYKSRAVSTAQRDQAVTEANVAEAALQAAEAREVSLSKTIAATEANIQQARAALKAARINLDYTAVTAPISGQIGKSNVSDGAIVTAYQPTPLATIQQFDPIYVDVPQSTVDLLKLKARLNSGQLQHSSEQSQVRLIQEDGTPYPLNGSLQFSDITVDATTGSVTLRALFPNPDGILLPNMFVRTLIMEGVNPQAILIPQQGVSRDPKGNPYALIVDESDKVVLRPLTLDRAVGNRWLVAAGLNAGDRLIVEGLSMLRPGTTVKASAFQPDAATAAPAEAK